MAATTEALWRLLLMAEGALVKWKGGLHLSFIQPLFNGSFNQWLTDGDDDDDGDKRHDQEPPDGPQVPRPGAFSRHDGR